MAQSGMRKSMKYHVYWIPTYAGMTIDKYSINFRIVFLRPFVNYVQAMTSSERKLINEAQTL